MFVEVTTDLLENPSEVTGEQQLSGFTVNLLEFGFERDATLEIMLRCPQTTEGHTVTHFPRGNKHGV